MAYKMSRSHALSFFPVGLYGRGGVLAKPRTKEKLECRIRKVITNVPNDFLQKVVDSIPGRLRKLVDTACACIEL